MNIKRTADKPGVVYIEAEVPRYHPPERTPDEKEWDSVIASLFHRELPDERWIKIAQQIGRE